MKPVIDLNGKTFGRLTIIERVLPNYRGGTRWKCLCQCKGEIVALGMHLTRGRTNSCGCLQKERARAANTTHGKRRTPIYEVWCSMMARCYRETKTDFHRYGGRGITVCERWHSFENFYADMGDRPAGLTIERKDNDGNYESGNCCWATRKEQGANRSTNHRVVVDGKTVTLRAACELLGKSYGAACQRIYRGASIDEAIR